MPGKPIRREEGIVHLATQIEQAVRTCASDSASWARSTFCRAPIAMRGSLLLLFGAAAAYLVVTLGIGLFISTLVDTQQQAISSPSSS